MLASNDRFWGWEISQGMLSLEFKTHGTDWFFKFRHDVDKFSIKTATKFTKKCIRKSFFLTRSIKDYTFYKNSPST